MAFRKKKKDIAESVDAAIIAADELGESGDAFFINNVQAAGHSVEELESYLVGTGDPEVDAATDIQMAQTTDFISQIGATPAPLKDSIENSSGIANWFKENTPDFIQDIINIEPFIEKGKVTDKKTTVEDLEKSEKYKRDIQTTNNAIELTSDLARIGVGIATGNVGGLKMPYKLRKYLGSAALSESAGQLMEYTLREAVTGAINWGVDDKEIAKKVTADLKNSDDPNGYIDEAKWNMIWDVGMSVGTDMFLGGFKWAYKGLGHKFGSYIKEHKFIGPDDITPDQLRKLEEATGVKVPLNYFGTKAYQFADRFTRNVGNASDLDTKRFFKEFEGMYLDKLGPLDKSMKEIGDDIIKARVVAKDATVASAAKRTKALVAETEDLRGLKPSQTDDIIVQERNPEGFWEDKTHINSAPADRFLNMDMSNVKHYLESTAATKAELGAIANDPTLKKILPQFSSNKVTHTKSNVLFENFENQKKQAQHVLEEQKQKVLVAEGEAIKQRKRIKQLTNHMDITKRETLSSELFGEALPDKTRKLQARINVENMYLDSLDMATEDVRSIVRHQASKLNQSARELTTLQKGPSDFITETDPVWSLEQVLDFRKYLGDSIGNPNIFPNVGTRTKNKMYASISGSIRDNFGRIDAGKGAQTYVMRHAGGPLLDGTVGRAKLIGRKGEKTLTEKFNDINDSTSERFKQIEKLDFIFNSDLSQKTFENVAANSKYGEEMLKPLLEVVRRVDPKGAQDFVNKNLEMIAKDDKGIFSAATFFDNWTKMTNEGTVKILMQGQPELKASYDSLAKLAKVAKSIDPEGSGHLFAATRMMSPTMTGLKAVGNKATGMIGVNMAFDKLYTNKSFVKWMRDGLKEEISTYQRLKNKAGLGDTQKRNLARHMGRGFQLASRHGYLNDFMFFVDQQAAIAAGERPGR